MSQITQGVFPHMVIQDAAAAITFYREALGATEKLRVTADDGKRILHAELEINGATVMLMDDFPEYRDPSVPSSATPTSLGGTTIILHLEVPDCDAAFERAIRAGAKPIMPPEDAFWGARYAQVTDPFGHAWSFSHPLPGAKTEDTQATT